MTCVNNLKIFRLPFYSA